MPNKYALIQNGIIVNTVLANPNDQQDPNYIWVDITNISPQPCIGYTTSDNQTFTGPSIIPMTSQQTAELGIQAASTFGENLIVQFAAQNEIAGITASGQTLAVISYTADLSQCLYTGSLLAAISIMQEMLQDNSAAKQACVPFVTNMIIESYINQIQTYLGLPLT